jgi:hypothetical protein
MKPVFIAIPTPLLELCNILDVEPGVFVEEMLGSLCGTGNLNTPLSVMDNLQAWIISYGALKKIDQEVIHDSIQLLQEMRKNYIARNLEQQKPKS